MTNERQATQGSEQTATANNHATGDKSAGLSIVEQAREERQRLATENERLEKNIRELREVEASRLLGGTAGGRVEIQPHIETAKEYAEKIMSGKR